MAVGNYIFSLLLISAPCLATPGDAAGRLVRSEVEETGEVAVSSNGATLRAATPHVNHGHSGGQISHGDASLLEQTADSQAASLTEKSGHFERVEMNFCQGDVWPAGGRSDMGGQIGYSFVAHADFKITALGRRVGAAGAVLTEATVTLWGPSKGKIAKVRVGPSDLVEDGYVWKELEAPISIKAGGEYRITQLCAIGMADAWWDGFIKDKHINVHHHTAADYAEVRHGVSSGNVDAFPANDDGIGRRAGMLNFRIFVVPTYAKSRCCNPHGSEPCAAGVAEPGWLTFDQCMEKCRYAPKESPCMGVQFSTRHCDTAQTCRCQLVPEGGCGSYTTDAAWNYFSTFGPKHTVRLSQKSSGRLEVRHGTPGEWGNVCKNGFGLSAAQVVCRQLHMWYGTVLPPTAMSIGGTRTGKIWMNEVMCDGGEPEIEECSFGGWGFAPGCTHEMDIGVNCTIPTPGPAGVQGPPGFPGPAAANITSDVRGPAGFTGLTGPRGYIGANGRNEPKGPRGDTLPKLDIAFDTSENMTALVTMPVFIFGLVFSCGITSCLYLWGETMVNPRAEVGRTLSFFIEGKQDQKNLKAIWKKSDKRGEKDDGYAKWNENQNGFTESTEEKTAREQS